MPRVKRAALFYGNKRMATLQNVTYRINTNDTQEVADSGAYNTDGQTVTAVDCDTIVPEKGVGVSVVRDAVEHRDVALTLFLVNGETHELQECRTTTCEFASEAASGKQTGRFSFHGPKPIIT